MGQESSGPSLGFAPRSYPQRTPGRGQSNAHWTGNYVTNISRSSFDAFHSPHATSCRTPPLKHGRSEPHTRASSDDHGRFGTMRSCWMLKVVTLTHLQCARTHSVVMTVPLPYVIERACTLQSAWLRQNVGFSLYIPDCAARRQPGPKVRQAHRHRRSANQRSGRQTLPGGAVPVRLRTTSHPTDQLSDLRRCPVVRMLARPAQIRAEALPGLRRDRHDPARPPKLLPRVRIRAGPGGPAGRQPVL
jgi:hypothetical protein